MIRLLQKFSKSKCILSVGKSLSKNSGIFLRYAISPKCHVVSTLVQSTYPCLLFALCNIASANCLEGSSLIMIFLFTPKGSQAGSVGQTLCRSWVGLVSALLPLGQEPAVSPAWAWAVPVPHRKGATAQLAGAPGEAVGIYSSKLGTSRQQLPGVKKCIK